MILRYVGPSDSVEVQGRVVQRGDTLSIPKALGGRPPDPRLVEVLAELVEHVNDHGRRLELRAELAQLDPGEGLLAQHDNWVVPEGPTEKPSLPSGAEAPDGVPDSREANGEATESSGDSDQ